MLAHCPICSGRHAHRVAATDLAVVRRGRCGAFYVVAVTGGAA
ncbi:hypothetical protein [Modestobacter marinus]|nr:hypothetical protein [Modestobacter marinus]